MDADASKTFVDALYRKVLLAVKASNAIPTEEDDYHYHCKFSRKFAAHVASSGTKVQELVWQLTDQDKKKKKKQDDEDDEEDEEEAARELFDGPEPNARITDFVDTLLDEATKQLELFQSGGSTKTANTAKPLENKPLSFDKSKRDDPKKPASDAAMTSHTRVSGMNKPQDQFDEKIDNSDAPFVCKLREKPHALESSGAQEDEDDEADNGHPYYREITSLKYLDWQLTASARPFQKIPVTEASYLWVHTKETLSQMMDVLLKPETQVIAVDLEHHSYRSYLGIVCLMQISTESHDFLVDTLALRSDLQVLNHVFCDPARVKVLHGADMDILWLQHDLGLYVVNMFDTGQAARLLQYPRYALAYLLKRHCNIDADKQYQLADWRIRPLDKNMIKYAREDTRYLLYIYDQMKQELLDQSGHQTRSSLLFEALQNSNKLCLQVYAKPEVSEDDCVALSDKLKGTVGIPVLSELQRRVFTQLYYWRDRIAREQDESPAFVLPNNVLMKITKYLPTKSDQLFRTCHPVPALVRKYAHELTTMIASEKTRLAAEQAAGPTTQQSVKDLLVGVTPQKKQTDDDDVVMESPALANIKQLCEYAGWQSGKRKAKYGGGIQDSEPVGLRLSFTDCAMMEVDDECLSSLEKVNTMVSSTSFVLTESERSHVFQPAPVDVQPSDQTEDMMAVSASIPQSIAEIYQLSNRSKKRRKGAAVGAPEDASGEKPAITTTASSAVQERADDFMKQIGWKKESKVDDPKPAFQGFDYAAASEKVHGAQFDLDAPSQPKKKVTNHKAGGYNPFVAVRGNSSSSSASGSAADGKKIMKKLHQAPRSATFR